MQESCVIKSNKYGLELHLSDSVPFDQLVYDVCVKFASSKSVFLNSTKVISFKGRTLSDEETEVLLDAIQLNCDLQIPLILEDNELKDIRMKGQMDRFYMENISQCARIISGGVTGHDEVFSQQSLVVLGDVEKNASISAKGNLIIFGTLRGHASFDGEYLVCRDFSCKEITHQEKSYEVTLPKKGLFSKKNSYGYRLQVLENQLLVTALEEPYVS